MGFGSFFGGKGGGKGFGGGPGSRGGPGARGGKFYKSADGKIHYGKAPTGKKSHAPKMAKPAAASPAAPKRGRDMTRAERAKLRASTAMAKKAPAGSQIKKNAEQSVKAIKAKKETVYSAKAPASLAKMAGKNERMMNAKEKASLSPKNSREAHLKAAELAKKYGITHAIDHHMKMAGGGAPKGESRMMNASEAKTLAKAGPVKSKSESSKGVDPARVRKLAGEMHDEVVKKAGGKMPAVKVTTLDPHSAEGRQTFERMFGKQSDASYAKIYGKGASAGGKTKSDLVSKAKARSDASYKAYSADAKKFGIKPAAKGNPFGKSKSSSKSSVSKSSPSSSPNAPPHGPDLGKNASSDKWHEEKYGKKDRQFKPEENHPQARVTRAIQMAHPGQAVHSRTTDKRKTTFFVQGHPVDEHTLAKKVEANPHHRMFQEHEKSLSDYNQKYGKGGILDKQLQKLPPKDLHKLVFDWVDRESKKRR